MSDFSKGIFPSEGPPGRDPRRESLEIFGGAPALRPHVLFGHPRFALPMPRQACARSRSGTPNSKGKSGEKYPHPAFILPGNRKNERKETDFDDEDEKDESRPKYYCYDSLPPIGKLSVVLSLSLPGRPVQPFFFFFFAARARLNASSFFQSGHPRGTSLQRSFQRG